jgi:hypothetical protein
MFAVEIDYYVGRGIVKRIDFLQPGALSPDGLISRHRRSCSSMNKIPNAKHQITNKFRISVIVIYLLFVFEIWDFKYRLHGIYAVHKHIYQLISFSS